MARTPFSVNKFRLSFAAWWLTWAVLHGVFLHWLGFDDWVSAKEALISNLLLAACCILVISNLKYYRPRQERYWYLALVSLVLCSAWVFISKELLKHINSNDIEYQYFLTRTIPVRFGIGFLLIACLTMISMMWYAMEDQKENEKRKSEAEGLAKEAELFKLRQQLQPHFLFNCLNSINALIGIDAEQARTMIQQLSEFLRTTIKSDEKAWIPLSEELEYLQLYLAIEKQRFGHRLSATVEADENCLHILLPNLLLQPIVENAIKFGLYDTIGDICIQVDAKISGTLLMITVRNPFDPETTLNSQGLGFGLRSVQRRLHLLFGRADLLQTSTTANTFIVTLSIPQQNITAIP